MWRSRSDILKLRITIHTHNSEAAAIAATIISPPLNSTMTPSVDLSSFPLLRIDQLNLHETKTLLQSQAELEKLQEENGINPIDNGEFQQTTPERLDGFLSLLEDRNLIVNVRRSRGKDIDAACGQLANKNAAGEEAPRKVISPA